MSDTEIIYCGYTKFHDKFRVNWRDKIYFSKYLHHPLIILNDYDDYHTGDDEERTDEYYNILHREHDMYGSRNTHEWESDKCINTQYTNIV